MNVPIFSSIQTSEKDGVAMEYGLAGHSDAPVLLLLHAIRNTKMLFAGIIPTLAQHYRVVAVDLRGHGQSTETTVFSFEDIVNDLIGLLDAEALDQVTVVAASFSAVPAQMLAVREPKRIARLILLDGGFYQLTEMPGFDLPSVVQRLSATRFPTVEEAERQFADRYGDGNLPKGWMATELEQKNGGYFGYRLSREAFTAYFRAYATFDKQGLFQSVSCPVLLLLADPSHLPDDEQRAFYREAVDSYKRIVTQAEIHSIPGALHLLMVTHPKETVRKIMAFTRN
ncbi:alpha/beta hydrolase [Brevibacillus choshinensis]|uniref:Alpha/beta hydrolase n=1 Tax=Brevibacillus choshinensis TaxID=54911 RepID=A0ABR5N7U6_BRECH|nr:alpha/beta hydrolase [Brevibacillus choshinensis]KQL46680.1 alpha/beta hydrolase [Brevibacillus choshinensis]